MIDFSSPKIMGIVNVTPDSFSDGGLWSGTSRILEMIDEGADIIDIGGESTGPGSKDVSAAEELARVKSVIDEVAVQGLTKRAVFSVDTYKAEVAEYALSHGFHMVNDVTALRGDPRMKDVLLKYKPYVVLMYSKDATARTTREATQYADVVATVKTFLKERVDFLTSAGFPKEKIIIDPGMGAFVSADPQYSFELIERLGELRDLGCPILVGVSRKSFLGGDVGARDEASAKWSLKAIQNGASVVRLHEVKSLIKILPELP